MKYRIKQRYILGKKVYTAFHFDVNRNSWAELKTLSLIPGEKTTKFFFSKSEARKALRNYKLDHETDPRIVEEGEM